jgi:hypothetical protein
MNYILTKILEWFGFKDKDKSETKVSIPQFEKINGIKFSGIYDPWTKKTSQIMLEVANELNLPNKNFSVLIQPDLTKEILSDEQTRIPQNGRLEIFCGHGTGNALLGPYVEGTDVIVENRINHSYLYTVKMIPNGGVKLFAFCCSAGEVFGPTFIYQKDNSFLGFNGKILFIFNDDFFMDKCGEIIKAAIRYIIVSDGFDERHLAELRKLFTRLMHYFYKGEGRTMKNSMLYAEIFSFNRRKLCYMEHGKPIVR